jgi:hypothetical protein
MPTGASARGHAIPGPRRGACPPMYAENRVARRLGRKGKILRFGVSHFSRR